MKILLDQPATADRLAWRISTEFLGEGAATREELAALAKGLRATQLDVGQAVARVLRSEGFSATTPPPGGCRGPWSGRWPRRFLPLDPPPSPLRLAELAEGWAAFLDDLRASRLEDRVALFAFSEFGRHVAENASGGTDHGTAGPVLVAGGRVRGGLIGATPRLLDLADDDVKPSLDFRRVYATVLEDWLGVPAEAALGGRFARLPVFRS